MPFQSPCRPFLSAALLVLATAPVAMPSPAMAQGLLGRIKRVVEQAEQTSNEAEQVAGSAERIFGPRRGQDRGQSQPSQSVDQTWNESAQMGADYGALDDGLGLGGPVASLTLYTSGNFRGYTSVVTEDAPSLHVPAINQGDKTYSLIAEGLWELCKDTQFRGECHVYEGEVPSLGRLGGTFSSARYVGVSQNIDGGFGESADGGMGEPSPPRLVLSDRHRLQGRIVEIFCDTPSLHGPDYRIGDLSYSLEAMGRWELCKDTNYRGQCVVYEGRHDELGRLGGTFSSARYLGPER